MIHTRGDIFNVGDLVRVRDWDDMVAEFGTCEYYDWEINCEAVFTESMQDLCGLEAEITAVYPNYRNENYTAYKTTNDKINEWVITADMLELVSEASDPVPDFQLANPAGFLF